MLKYFYIFLGLITSAIGIVAIFVPGLPTTVFIIIALWAFSKSNQRLHKWLTHLPILKNVMHHIRHYEEHKAISLEVKIISQICAWGSFLFMLSLPLHWVFKVLALSAALGCSAAMWKIKTLNYKDQSQ